MKKNTKWKKILSAVCVIAIILNTLSGMGIGFQKVYAATPTTTPSSEDFEYYSDFSVFKQQVTFGDYTYALLKDDQTAEADAQSCVLLVNLISGYSGTLAQTSNALLLVAESGVENTVSVKANTGSFQLKSFDMEDFGSGVNGGSDHSFTVTGYVDATLVATYDFTANPYTTITNISVTGDEWGNIDEFRIKYTGSHHNISIFMDNIIVSDPRESTAVTFTGLTANGNSGTSPTTELTLTFSKDPTTLSASNITVMGATKGTLSGTGTTRTLNISDITVGNGENVTVTVASPEDFKITPASKTVAVYKYIPTLTDITLTPTAVNYDARAIVGTKVADLAVAGTHTTGITYTLDGSGTDDSLFEIVGSELQIKSGTTLAAQSYTVMVKACEDAQPLNTVTKTISFTVNLQDTTPPTVTSITRQTPSAENTNAGSVIYQVAFNESVSGVDASDFVLTKTGTATGSIASVSSTSGSAIDVTVNTIEGQGTIRLDLKASGTEITDSIGNAITGGYTGGKTYTVDRSAPTLTAGAVSRTSDTSATVNFTSNEAGKYYYVVAASGAAKPSIVTSGAGANCAAAENTISLSTLSAGANDIYIVVKDAMDNVSVDTFKISIPAYVAPPSNGGGNGSNGSGGNNGGGNNSGGNNSGGVVDNSKKDSGVVEKTGEQDDGAPAVKVNNSSDELKESLLTSQEQEQVEKGENAQVILKVTDIGTSVSDEEKELIREKLVAENGISENAAADIPVLYVDLTLYKQVGSQDQIKVTETKGKISISIEVPEEFRNSDITKNRVFYVFRIHDGKVTRLEGSYDPVTHRFTFETDRFSTYALSYQDTTRIQTYHDFHHLQLTAKAGKTSQTLSYKRIASVDGYLIYGARCGEEMKELAKVSADTTTYIVKELKQGGYYKYQVKAYRIIDGEQIIIMTSKVIHSVTERKTYANPTKVTLSAASVTLTAGKSKTVIGQVVLPKGKKQKEHTAVIRYESSNKEIATVNSKGKISAKAKGTCYVYAYAQNGVYKRIKVTVK